MPNPYEDLLRQNYAGRKRNTQPNPAKNPLGQQVSKDYEINPITGGHDPVSTLPPKWATGQFKPTPDPLTLPDVITPQNIQQQLTMPQTIPQQNVQQQTTIPNITTPQTIQPQDQLPTIPGSQVGPQTPFTVDPLTGFPGTPDQGLTGDYGEDTGINNALYDEATQYLLSLLHGDSPLAQQLAQKDKQELAAKQAAQQQLLQQQMAQQGLSIQQRNILAGMSQRQAEGAQVEMRALLAKNQLMEAKDAATTLAQLGLQEEGLELQQDQLEFQKEKVAEAKKDKEWGLALQNYDPTNADDLNALKQVWSKLYPDKPIPSFDDMIEKQWEGKADEAGADLAVYVQEMYQQYLDPDTDELDYDSIFGDQMFMRKIANYWEAENFGDKFNINNAAHREWAEKIVKSMSMTMSQKAFNESVIAIHQSDWYKNLDEQGKKDIDEAMSDLEQLNLLGGFTAKKIDTDGDNIPDTMALFSADGTQWYPPDISGEGIVKDITLGDTDYKLQQKEDGSLFLTDDDGNERTFTYKDGKWFEGDTELDKATQDALEQYKPDLDDDEDSDLRSGLNDLLGRDATDEEVELFKDADPVISEAFLKGKYKDLMKEDLHDIKDFYDKLPDEYKSANKLSDIVQKFSPTYASIMRAIEDDNVVTEWTREWANQTKVYTTDEILVDFDEYSTGSGSNRWVLTHEAKSFLIANKDKYVNYKGKIVKILGYKEPSGGKTWPTIQIYDPVTNQNYDIGHKTANKPEVFTWDDLFAEQDLLLVDSPSANFINDYYGGFGG